MVSKNILSFLVALLFLAGVGCQGSSNPSIAEQMAADEHDIEDHIENDKPERESELAACRKATVQQLFQVNLGNDKKDEFLDQCIRQTGSSYWCSQLVRPNPNSVSTFRCTYGKGQVHQLIHPAESIWRNPIAAVKIIQDLSAKGIKVCEIYNWWRPEPYNKNVGGAAGRHPYGTSVDVRFCSNNEANKAFKELCKMRKQGRLRAIGHYGSASLHIGVGDRVANTWGKSCP